jgi:MFS family permease
VASPDAAEPLVEVPLQPARTLGLLSGAHAINHALGVLLPLVYLKVAQDFSVGTDAIAILTALGNFGAGVIQLLFGGLTRSFSRRSILAWGNILMGTAMAAQALAGGFFAFSVANIASRLGGSPQHPVGNAILAEQFPPWRRGFAISAHIAGGNVGTVAVPIVGTALLATLGWRATVVIFGIPAVVVAIGIAIFVHESGTDRAAAQAQGSVVAGFKETLRDRDLLILNLASTIAAGGRGLGVIALFAPFYLSRVVGLDVVTVGWMYTILLLGSVPAPLVAGWLSDRIGRLPVILASYLGAAAGMIIFVSVGSNLLGLWLGIIVMGVFAFVESPQLQAVLADIAPPHIRDVAFATYYTIAFGVGSLWTAVFGAILGVAGDAVGLPQVFWIMAATFVAAAIAVLPVRMTPRDVAAAG